MEFKVHYFWQEYRDVVQVMKQYWDENNRMHEYSIKEEKLSFEAIQNAKAQVKNLNDQWQRESIQSTTSTSR